MSDIGTFFERFRRQWPLEIVYRVAEWAFGNIWYLVAAGVAAVIASVSGWYTYVSALDPLIILAALIFIFVYALRAIGLILDFQQRQIGQWGSPWGSGWGKLSEEAPSDKRPVEFILPSNWEAGFNKFKNGPGIKGARPEREEVRLRVHANQKMENVRFEIEINQFGGSPPSRDTIARLSSNKFVGVVPKGTEETFVILRRSYWITSADFNHPEKDGRSSGTVRIEKEVTFFPESENAFQARLEENYHVKVKVLHDEGPDEAHFNVELHPIRFCPQSKITSMRNIKPVMGR